MRKLICLCNLIEQDELLSVLKKRAASVEDLQQMTGAGLSCGRCLPEIDELVKLHQKAKPKDQQKKLDFRFNLTKK
jgi:bacterioferritin-associated ferredoxin